MFELSCDCEEFIQDIDKICCYALSGALKKGLTEAALRLEYEAKKQIRDNCPEEWRDEDEDEQVRQSITHKVSDTEAVVGASNLMSIWMHQGTGLYAVNGDGRKEVPWYWKDERTGETKSSSGRKPFPYLEKALTENKEEILKCFKDKLEE